MNRWLLDIIVCPVCKEEFSLEEQEEDKNKEDISKGKIICNSCDRLYPITNGIPRFVAIDDDYCENFGYQWTKFCRTQIDKFSGSTESKDRFESETGWDSRVLNNKLVLDAGCGAGRFSDVALQFGARLIAVDVSGSVDACKKNLEELGYDTNQYQIIQVSIYDLPFRPNTFDYIYSIGVIQHTPDRKGSIMSLSKLLNHGQLALWVYEKSWRSLIGYKYWFRIATRQLSQESTWKLSLLLVKVFFPFAWYLAKVPRIGRYLVRLLPMAYRSPGPNGTKQQSEEWSLLDTFDNLSPRYDNPITESELKRWLKDANLPLIERRTTPGLAIVASNE